MLRTEPNSNVTPALFITCFGKGVIGEVTKSQQNKHVMNVWRNAPKQPKLGWANRKQEAQRGKPPCSSRMVGGVLQVATVYK